MVTLSVCSETLITLRGFSCRERNEEFIVRAYKGGPKKATNKSTLRYWKSYLSVKETFPTRWYLIFLIDKF